MRKITFGSSSRGVSLPGGYDPSWMAPPVTTDTTVNGKNDVMALVVNVLDVGNRNYFSCLATGNYTVNVYATVGGTLISTQNVASGVQANWQIDYAACTHQIDTVTRQAYIEIVGNGGNLTSIVFNTNHPAETNVNSAQNIVGAIGVLPAVTTMASCFSACYSLQSVIFTALPAVTTMTACFQGCYSLQSVIFPALPAVTTMTACFQACYSLQSVIFPALPAVTTMTACFQACESLQSVIFPALPAVTTMTACFEYCYSLQSVIFPALPAVTTMASCFGAAENQSLRSLRKIILTGLRYGFALNYGALQSQEINALFASLGTASGAQTVDVRNQPGSTTCDVSIAVLKGYTVVIT